MKNLILLCLSFSLTMAARHILDEEEFLDAKQFRDEALEVEREAAKLKLLARQAADVAEVVPAPVPHIDLRLGLDGYRSNNPQYGQPLQPQQFSPFRAPAPASVPILPIPWVPAPTSRTVSPEADLSIQRMCSGYAQSVLTEYTAGTARILQAYSELVQKLLTEQSEQKSRFRHNCGK